MTRAPLPDNGACTCGSKDLLLARDQTEYTSVRKDGEWELGVSSTEQMDTADPMGNVRLFCPACGEHFFVPEELE